jgi:XTP/dITP diphosphohydrolase
MKELIFATNNRHKLEEVQSIIGQHIKLISLADAGIHTEIPENQNTLEGNAFEKARFIKQLSGMDCFADDTGLEINSLDGAPGVHSARYAGPENNAAANIEKLLANLKEKSDRTGRFRTVIALIIDHKEYSFEGAVSGHIINSPKGSQGFGYDPVFVPEGHQLTFAEMDSAQKNEISHRAKAALKLAEFLSSHR